MWVREDVTGGRIAMQLAEISKNDVLGPEAGEVKSKDQENTCSALPCEW